MHLRLLHDIKIFNFGYFIHIIRTSESYSSKSYFARSDLYLELSLELLMIITLECV